MFLASLFPCLHHQCLNLQLVAPTQRWTVRVHTASERVDTPSSVVKCVIVHKTSTLKHQVNAIPGTTPFHSNLNNSSVRSSKTLQPIWALSVQRTTTTTANKKGINKRFALDYVVVVVDVCIGIGGHFKRQLRQECLVALPKRESQSEPNKRAFKN